MAVPVTAYPSVRTVTQLVRALLADELIGLGAVYDSRIITAISTATHIVTATFATAHGFIVGDNIVLAGMTPSSANGTFSVTAATTLTLTWQNNSAPDGSVSVIGTIQGYGTGKKYTDAVLMPYVNSAYRGLQRALKATGSAEFKVDEAFLTIPALSSSETSTNVNIAYSGMTIESDASPPPTFVTAPVGGLPQDLLVPLILWERQNGSTDIFIPMVDLTSTGGLPSRAQGMRLGVWEWIGDAISVLGAQQANDIRIRYQRGLPAVSDGASQLLVLDSEDYHAFTVAAMVTKSRGGQQTQEWDAAAEDSKEKLIAAYTRQQQGVSRRPRAFSSRRGFPSTGKVY